MNIGGLQIQYNISPLLGAPRILALLFTGAAGYIGLIDPKSRQALKNTQHKLQQWSAMYKHSLPVMGSLAVLSAAMSGVCYWKSNESRWLVGGALMAALWPYTYLVLMPINKELMKINETLNEGGKLSPEEDTKVLNKLDSWLNRHRVRVLISAVAVGIFFVAELYSVNDFSVTIARNKN